MIGRSLSEKSNLLGQLAKRRQARVLSVRVGLGRELLTACGGKAKIKVQRALLCYALKRLGLDTDPAARKSHDQQVVLVRKNELSGNME